MKRLLLLGLVCMLTGLSNVALAQGRRHDGLRIGRGVRSGAITRDEARLLRERQRAIRDQRRILRSDGSLSRDERRELRRDRREQGRLIRDLRRNDDRRFDNFNRRGNHRGNGYYRRGAGSPTHPVFGNRRYSRRSVRAF